MSTTANRRPTCSLHAVEVQGVSPACRVVVEDSPPGVTAAVAAGMRTLGFAGGLTPVDRLRDAGAEVFEQMAELPGLLALP